METFPFPDQKHHFPTQSELFLRKIQAYVRTYGFLFAILLAFRSKFDNSHNIIIVYSLTFSKIYKFTPSSETHTLILYSYVNIPFSCMIMVVCNGSQHRTSTDR